jgi:hypothetical protein
VPKRKMIFLPTRNSIRRNAAQIMCRCSWVPATGHLLRDWSQKIAEGLRANGCTHVETGLIPGSVHYVVEDEPETVADLIERYASGASVHSE